MLQSWSRSRHAHRRMSSTLASVYWPNELDGTVSLSDDDGSSNLSHGFALPAHPSEPSSSSSSSPSTRKLPSGFVDFAGRRPTPLRLGEILAMKKPEALQSVLQEELPVRLANRIAHLDTLPDLIEVDSICGVRADFEQSFSEVLEARPEDFKSAIRRLKNRNQHHAIRMTQGMKEWKAIRRAKGEPEHETNTFVDGFLDRLFLSRIGMETLTSQYLALSGNPDGIVDRNCDPCEVCERAAQQVSRMARSHGTKVPRVDISFHGSDPAKLTQTLPLIPQYLYYIVCELLKNSIRAVGELHEAQGNPGKPEPIEIRVASDESQVAILVEDKGGGIPFQRQPHVWSYMYSTAKGNLICEKTGAIVEAAAQPTPLSGYGVGLPLSRLYAEYIGGSLHLMSMPNYGTHAYLFLQQSSEREEALPTYVNWLRKRRLREDIISFEAREKHAVQARDYAEALRLKTLAAEAAVELSLLER
mmetsp:Transcript_92269/g.144879  ORF Transcript_92269/g.144879 Transcript_92269/m.144879 type:complete len:473 (+) Transcript_92269:48-1466(+)